jgi:hypothetical protein
MKEEVNKIIQEFLEDTHNDRQEKVYDNGLTLMKQPTFYEFIEWLENKKKKNQNES